MSKPLVSDRVQWNCLLGGHRIDVENGSTVPEIKESGMDFNQNTFTLLLLVEQPLTNPSLITI